ncbi:MAG: hypothetical protein P4L59_16250 [Desulfosporosinus sp.]|nr:hypothetical protein [Desulfosporosinus sp.]
MNKISEMLAQLLQCQTEMKQEIKDIKGNQVRMEIKYDVHIAALQDFKVIYINAS